MAATVAAFFTVGEAWRGGLTGFGFLNLMMSPMTFPAESLSIMPTEFPLNYPEQRADPDVSPAPKTVIFARAWRSRF